MSRNPTSTAPSPTRSACRPTPARSSPTWPEIRAEDLGVVCEPAAWDARLGPPRTVARLAPVLRLGLAGLAPADWDPPAWLLPHQRTAARRLAAALNAFGGALLCDAVGLGKSFVALALATRYASPVLVPPAAIRSQWRDLAARYGLAPRIVTHEALSRGGRLPAGDLVIVDEAHRFRDPGTRRYDGLARQTGRAALLLVTATPVVNRAADLTTLLRLFLSDHALAPLGVPSLERAADDVTSLAAGIAPLIVARSPETARPPTPLPDIHGSRVIRAPPLEPPHLVRVIGAIRELTFPTLGHDATPLLSRHLLGRLASSPEACAESVRRHRAYLERARDAARRGERLTRAAARSLFGAEDAGQLELLLSEAAPLSADQAALECEMARLDALGTLLGGAGPRPKLRRAVALLRRRAGRKTIVFTAARATAQALARALDWRHVAVAASRTARIASGRLPVEEVFALFAPRAQRREDPLPGLRLDTLIATDVASEGLNLQDADAVIHYDLPWTPLALEQRVGRVRRIGSAHRAVRVWWLAPPAVLDRHLDLTRRIARKARLQIALATPRTAAVGRVALMGGLLDRRERLLDGPVGVVRGAASAGATAESVAVVRLPGRRAEVFRVLAERSAGLPVAVVERALAAADAGIPTSTAPAWLVARLRDIATLADRTPAHPVTRTLVRAVTTRARVAARQRSTRQLELLDRVLQQVLGGLPAGAERELAELLEDFEWNPMVAWCDRWSGRAPELGRPELLAVVWGVADRDPLPIHETSGYIRVHGGSRQRRQPESANPTSC